VLKIKNHLRREPTTGGQKHSRNAKPGNLLGPDPLIGENQNGAVKKLDLEKTVFCITVSAV